MWGRFCDSIPRCRSGEGSMVALAVSERLSVEELRDAARAEPRGKVRARLLAMAQLRAGGERGATARQFGMSRNVLRIWVGRYNAAGIEEIGRASCRERV